MTVTFPTSARAALPAATMVRIRHNVGLFKIVASAAWADAGHTAPTHYDVTGPDGRLHRMVPRERMTALSYEPTLYQPNAQPVLKRDTVLQRMQLLPDLTRRMGRFYLGEQAQSMELDTLIRALLPRYRECHCWSCWKPLNNLNRPVCPKCGGIQCACGACFCNRSASTHVF